MLRGTKNKFDIGEITRRMKRSFDSGFTYRKLFLILVVVAVFLYVGSPFFRWLFYKNEESKDPIARCIDDRLTPFYLQSLEFNAHIKHSGVPSKFIPYVGNGYFGIEIEHNAHLNIKRRRSLTLPIYFHPFLSLSSSNGKHQEATVVEYLNGIVHRFQCFQDYFVSYEYFAHRNLPSILVQEIKITNTRNQIIDVELNLPRISNWPSAVSKEIKLQYGSTILEYQVISGFVSGDQITAVSVVTRKMGRTITLKKRGMTKLELIIAIHYTPFQSSKPNDKDALLENEKLAIDALKRALLDIQHEPLSNQLYNFKTQHMKVWNTLWDSGFTISTSKAENSINGDRINGTMYAVLSNVRSYEFEEFITPQKKEDIARSLTYAEGCYDSYHTLQAENLWLDMESLEGLNNVVSSWMLTLEKQGCHNLIRAGASGVIQAMILSFGSFRFSNQHLEFNIHPKFLHRDYHFRRLNYGNMTHVNVTVSVTEDNKAIISVALDRSDRSYYACDAGCLDEPILLGPLKKIFPVKVTDPITAILYITSDKQHIEELHDAIHVKEVIEAPAHEHHVIALHKHGHHLGGLPTFFWVSIFAIIIVFHVFLCKLIIKEYCEPPDKMRYRYNKP